MAFTHHSERSAGSRLNDAEHIFSESREFSAPRDLQMIFFFAESGAVKIETENILKIFGKR
jgi:hypothetical protein